MTTLEYQTLIFPPNLFHNLTEFEQFIKIKEDGWEVGLKNLLKRCEDEELFEYCALIKKELDENSVF